MNDPFARFRQRDISSFSLSDQGLVEWVVVGAILAAVNRGESEPFAAGLRDSRVLLLSAPALTLPAKAFIDDHCPYR